MEKIVERRSVQLELPWIPSINHYWRHVGHRVLISREGRAYRERVLFILRDLGLEPFTGDVSLTVKLFPPDARKRDTDNVLKALLDSLQHGGAFADDNQVKRIDISMRPTIVPGGVALVTLESM